MVPPITPTRETNVPVLPVLQRLRLVNNPVLNFNPSQANLLAAFNAAGNGALNAAGNGASQGTAICLGGSVELNQR